MTTSISDSGSPIAFENLAPTDAAAIAGRLLPVSAFGGQTGWNPASASWPDSAHTLRPVQVFSVVPDAAGLPELACPGFHPTFTTQAPFLQLGTNRKPENCEFQMLLAAAPLQGP